MSKMLKDLDDSVFAESGFQDDSLNGAGGLLMAVL